MAKPRRGGDAGACGKVLERMAVTQVLVVRFCLGKTHGGDAGACGRGGDAGTCSKVVVLAKRVAVTQVLLVRFWSWRYAKRVAVTQVLAA